MKLETMKLETIERDLCNNSLIITLKGNELPNTRFINDQLWKQFNGLKMVEIINAVRNVPIELYYSPDDITELINNLHDDYVYTLEQAHTIISWIEDVRSISSVTGQNWQALYNLILEEAGE